MGNQQTLPFESDPWQVFKRQGNCTYLKNKITNEIVQKYLIHKEYQNKDDEQSLFKWRCNLNPNRHVIQVFQYGVKAAGSCEEVDQFYVITEHIQKFNRLPIMSKPQSFLFLKHIIEGLITLKSKFGLFSPTPYHIGVNKFGHGKVWINQNFASNQVQIDGLVGRFQQTVVNNICKLVQTKVINKQPNEISYPHHMNFQIAMQYIQKLMQNEKDFQVKRIKTTLALSQNHSNPQQEVTKSNNQYTDNSRNTNLNFQARTTNNFNPNYSTVPSQQQLFIIPQKRQSSLDSNYNSNSSRISRNSYHFKPGQQNISKKSDNIINRNSSLQAIPQFYPANFIKPAENIYISPPRSNNQLPPMFNQQAYRQNNHTTIQNFNRPSNNFFTNQIPIQKQISKFSPVQNQFFHENKFSPSLQNQRVPVQIQQLPIQTNIQQNKSITGQKKIVSHRKHPIPSKNISIHSQLRIKEDIQQVDSVILIPQED